MSLTRDEIMDAALKLDPAEREILAERLLLSVTAAQREQIDSEWIAEVQRRDADFAAGKMVARPVQQVVDRLSGKARK